MVVLLLWDARALPTGLQDGRRGLELAVSDFVSEAVAMTDYAGDPGGLFGPLVLAALAAAVLSSAALTLWSAYSGAAWIIESALG
jgi:hypothetical protein